jgi:hypothetical protein
MEVLVSVDLNEINHKPMPARSPADHHPITASLKASVEALQEGASQVLSIGDLSPVLRKHGPGTEVVCAIVAVVAPAWSGVMRSILPVSTTLRAAATPTIGTKRAASI